MFKDLDDVLKNAKSLKDLLAARDELTQKTGTYFGIQELKVKEEDPLKFEQFYAELHSVVLRAREHSRLITASPGGREMGESLWSLCTPDVSVKYPPLAFKVGAKTS